MLVPPLVIAGGLTADDWRRAALTIADRRLRRADVALAGHPAAARSGSGVSALEPVESQLDAVLRAATGHLIIGCDLDGTITVFNPGAERMLGWRGRRGRRPDDDAELPRPGRDAGAARATRRRARVAAMLATNAARRARRDPRLDMPHEGRPAHHRLAVDQRHHATRPAPSPATSASAPTSPQARAGDADRWRRQREIYRLLVEHGCPRRRSDCATSSCAASRSAGTGWRRPAPTRRSSSAARSRTSSRSRTAQRAGPRLRARPGTSRSRSRWICPTGARTSSRRCRVDGPDGAEAGAQRRARHHRATRAELERQEMLAALAVSEASFREAFEGAPIGIALTTVQEPTERFLRVNPAFAAHPRPRSRGPGRRRGRRRHPSRGRRPAARPVRRLGRRKLRKRFLRAVRAGGVGRGDLRGRARCRRRAVARHQADPGHPHDQGVRAGAARRARAAARGDGQPARARPDPHRSRRARSRTSCARR